MTIIDFSYRSLRGLHKSADLLLSIFTKTTNQISCYYTENFVRRCLPINNNFCNCNFVTMFEFIKRELKFFIDGINFKYFHFLCSKVIDFPTLVLIYYKTGNEASGTFQNVSESPILITQPNRQNLIYHELSAINMIL